MPQEIKAKSGVAPTPNFLQRLFGQTPMTPEMEEGARIAKSENPNLAPIQTYGMMSRLLSPKAMAYASPGRNIYLNPSQLQGQSPQDIADTLIHEQTHVDQMKRSGVGPTMELLHQMFGSQGKLPYGQRPDEMEAFQNEKNRRYKMGRIQTAVPSFSNPGEFMIPQGDINLPRER